MDDRYISFHYFNEKHRPEYKEEVRKFLKSSLSQRVEEIGFPGVFVDMDTEFKRDVSLTGHVFVYKFFGEAEKFEDVCKYILSKDRMFVPECVSCKKKEDYGMIENILKENYGGKGRLSNGFLGLSRFFGTREIKIE